MSLTFPTTSYQHNVDNMYKILNMCIVKLRLSVKSLLITKLKFGTPFLRGHKYEKLILIKIKSIEF